MLFERLVFPRLNPSLEASFKLVSLSVRPLLLLILYFDRETEPSDVTKQQVDFVLSVPVVFQSQL